MAKKEATIDAAALRAEFLSTDAPNKKEVSAETTSKGIDAAALRAEYLPNSAEESDADPTLGLKIGGIATRAGMGAHRLNMRSAYNRESALDGIEATDAASQSVANMVDDARKRGYMEAEQKRLKPLYDYLESEGDAGEGANPIDFTQSTLGKSVEEMMPKGGQYIPRGKALLDIMDKNSGVTDKSEMYNNTDRLRAMYMLNPNMAKDSQHVEWNEHYPAPTAPIMTPSEDGLYHIGENTYTHEDMVNALSGYMPVAQHNRLLKYNEHYRDDYARSLGYKSWDDAWETPLKNLTKELETINEELASETYDKMVAASAFETAPATEGTAFGTYIADMMRGGLTAQQELEKAKALTADDFISGFDEGFNTVEVMSLGYAGIGASVNLYNILEKVNNDQPLSEREEKVYRAYEIGQELEQLHNEFRGGKMSRGRRWGQGVGTSTEVIAQFAVSMAATGGIGSGIAAANMGLKQAFKQGLKSGLKQTVKMGSKKAGVYGARSAAAASFSPMTYSTFADRRVGQYRIDESGNLVKETRPWAKDLGIAYVETFNEYLSEYFGDGMGKLIDVSPSKIGRMFGLDKWAGKKGYGNIGDYLDATFVPTKRMREAMHHVDFAGFVWEAPSEAFGDFMNSLMLAPFSEEHGFEQFATKEYWEDLYGTTAIFGGALSVLGSPATIKNMYNTSKNVKRREAALGKIQDVELRNNLKSVMSLDSMEEMSQAMVDLHIEKLSPDQAAAAVEYLTSATMVKVLTGADMEDTRLLELDDYVKKANNVVYKGKDGSLPSDEIIKVVDKNGHELYVEAGDVNNTSDVSMLKCKAYDAENRKWVDVAVPASEVMGMKRESVEQVISAEYQRMFGTEIMAERLKEIEGARKSMENPSAEVVRGHYLRNGLKVYDTGEEVSLADGRTAVVESMLADGSYLVRSVNPTTQTEELYEVPFMQVLQPEASLAEAQKQMFAKNIESAAQSIERAEVTEQSAEAGVAEEEDVDADMEDVVEQAQEMPKPVPTREDGSVDFSAIDDSKMFATEYTKKMGGEDKAKASVAKMAANARAEASQLREKSDKMTDPNEVVDAVAKADAMDARADFYDKVLAEYAPQEEAQSETYKAGDVVEYDGRIAEVVGEENEGVVIADAQGRMTVVDPTTLSRVAEAPAEENAVDPIEDADDKLIEATEAGIVQNVFGKMLDARTANVIDAMAKALGVKVAFVESVTTQAGTRANADIKGNVVRIAWAQRRKAISFLAGHEFTHRMKDMSPEAYAEFTKSVKKYLGEAEWQRRMDAKRAIYELHNKKAKAEGKPLLSYEDALLEEEVVADFVGDMVENRHAFEHYVQKQSQKPSLLQAIKKVLSAIGRFFRRMGARTEAQRMKEMIAHLDTFINKAREDAKKNGVQESGEARNSLPSLVGVHNLSLDKLRKAIKMGGLANPSVAVIDVDKQTHVDYGEYSLILPKNIVDARQGKNAGTWAGDAWTPTYPQVVKRMNDDKAISRFYKDIDALPEAMRSRVRLDFDSFMDGRSANALAYWYLFEKGNAPEMVLVPSRYSNDVTNAVSEATNGSFSMFNLTPEERAKCLDAYIAVKFDGDRAAFEAEMQARIERLAETIETKKSDRVKKWAQDTIDSIKEYGFDYDDVANFIRDVGYDAREKGKVNVDATILAAQERINESNLVAEYDAWRNNLDERYGIDEFIFDGYTNSGNRRYLPHTVENASKWMKKQGRQGAVATFPSFGTFVAVSIPKMTTLESIRKRKALLGKSKEEYDAFREKWENVYYELGKKLQPDAKSFEDYGYWRLIEAVGQKNPKEFIKKEYGVELSEEDMTQLNEMLNAIRTEYPARYFETKFERPLQLSDFTAAVVPNDIPLDVESRLKDANVEVIEYEKGDNASRAEAMQKASQVENVRFSLPVIQGVYDALKEYEATSDIETFVNKVRDVNDNVALGHPFLTNAILDYDEFGAEEFERKVRMIVGDYDDGGYAPYTAGGVRYSLPYNGDVTRVFEDARKIAKSYYIPQDIIVAGSVKDYKAAMLSYGVPEEKIILESAAVYLDWEDVIVVNAVNIFNPEFYVSVLAHENMHAITRREKDKVEAIAKKLPIMQILKFAEKEFGYSLDYIKNNLNGVSFAVVDEIISTFVEQIAAMPVSNWGYVLRRYLTGSLTIDEAMEACELGIAELYKGEYEKLTDATKGLLRENLIKLRDEQYKAEKVGNTIFWGESGTSNGGGIAIGEENEEDLRAQSHAPNGDGTTERAEADRRGEGADAQEVGYRHSIEEIIDTPSDEEYKQQMLELAQQMERDAEERNLDKAQEIADVTGWVHLDDGTWKYYGDVDITEDAKESTRVRRWLESKAAVKKARTRKMYDDLLKEQKKVAKELESESKARRSNASYAKAVDAILQGQAHEALPIEDQILVDVALGQKLRWDDEQGGSRRGLKTELGLRSTTAEGMAEVTGGNAYIEDYVAAVVERNNGYENGIDDNDVRNAVIEVFGSYPSRKAALAELSRRYPDTALNEATEAIAQLEQERDEALAQIDADLSSELADAEANPLQYERAYEEEGTWNLQFDIYTGALRKARNEVSRMERDIQKAKLTQREKTAAMRTVKRAVVDMLKGDLGRYTRKRDIQALMDAVNEAQTLYAMQRAIDKAMLAINELRLRKETARMNNLLKMRISSYDSAIDPRIFFENMMKGSKNVDSAVRRLMNDYWRGVNSSGVDVAKGVDGDTARVLQFIRNHSNLTAELGKAPTEEDILKRCEAWRKELRGEAVETAIFSDTERKEIEALTPEVRERMADAVSVVEGYLMVQYQLQNMDKGVTNARQEIAAEKAQIKKLNKEIKALQEQKVAVTDGRIVDAKKSIEEKKKKVEQLHRDVANARIKNASAYIGAMPDILDAFSRLNAQVESLLMGGRVDLADFRAKREAHKRELVNMVLEALDNPEALDRNKPNHTAWQKVKDTGFVRFFTNHLGSLDYMLRSIDRNAPNGEGMVHTYFTTKLADAKDAIYENSVKAVDILNSKAQALFGTTFGRAMRKAERKVLGTMAMTRTKEDGTKITEEYEMTVATALYTMMMWNQPASRPALENMGATEEDIEQLRTWLNANNPAWLQFAGWVVNDFLPSNRARYNEVYRAMNGTDMDFAENYFPIRRMSTAIPKEVDLADPSFENKPSTVTGAIMKRTENKLPIDLETSFFGALQDNIVEMEEWSALAPIISDFNAILSSPAVKKTMGDMGKYFHNDFQQAAKVATLKYAGDTKKLDGVFWQMVYRTWASAKLAFKAFTALKQLASSVLFLPYSGDIKFWGRLLHYYLGGKSKLSDAIYEKFGDGSLTNREEGEALLNIKWAYENSSMFRRRWDSGVAGNDIFTRELKYDSRTKAGRFMRGVSEAVNWLQKFGMAPIAFVDAYTVSAGMRAIYEYELANLTQKEGYTKEEAKKIAMRRAEMIANKSQQSSEGEYLAPLQMERGWMTSLTMFQNAPFAQGRNIAEAWTEITRNTDKEYAFIKKQEIARMKKARAAEYEAIEATIAMEKELGIITTEEQENLRREKLQRPINAEIEAQAHTATKKKIVRAKMRAYRTLLYNAFLGQFVFNLMGKLPYLLFGDDEEKKKKMWIELAWLTAFAPVSTITAGGTLMSILGGHKVSFSGALSEFEDEWNKIVSEYKNDGFFEAMLAAGDFLIRKGFGVDYETFMRMYAGIENMFESGMSAENIFMALNAPDSQVRLLAGDRKEGETAQEYATRIMRLYSIFSNPEYSDYYNEKFSYRGDNPAFLMSDYMARSMKKNWEMAYRSDVMRNKGLAEEWAAVLNTEEEYEEVVEALGFKANRTPAKEAGYIDGEYRAPIEGLSEDDFYDLKYLAWCAAGAAKYARTYLGGDEKTYLEYVRDEMEAKRELISEYNKILNK